MLSDFDLIYVFYSMNTRVCPDDIGKLREPHALHVLINFLLHLINN